MSEGVFALLLAGLVVAVLVWVFWQSQNNGDILHFLRGLPASSDQSETELWRGNTKVSGVFLRSRFVSAPAKPHGHRHPQVQTQESRGKVFCINSLHAGQCRVQVWSGAVGA
jgi:hypothetical protein